METFEADSFETGSFYIDSVHIYRISTESAQL